VLSWLSPRDSEAHKAAKLYGAVVTQARRPAFYADCGIADTPQGRYGLIVLHLALLLERLRGAGEPASGLSRLLIETFVTDMDDNMREMGVGDLTVPKKVKRAAAGLYERAEQYRRALADADPSALVLMLTQTLPGLEAHLAPRVAEYTRAAVGHLASTPFDRLAAGSVTYPDAPTRPAGEEVSHG
jgi:cytochrome b pre-mRNA-processing protein 3